MRDLARGEDRGTDRKPVVVGAAGFEPAALCDVNAVLYR